MDLICNLFMALGCIVISNDRKGVDGMGDPSEKYLSAKVLLAAMQDIYQYELSSNEQMKNRAGIFIAFSGVILAMIAGNIKEIMKFDLGYENKAFLLLSGVALIILFIAIVNFILVIGTRKYPRLGSDLFFDKNLSKNILYPENQSMYLLISIYNKICTSCVNINKTIATFFRIGTWLTLISLMFFLIAIAVVLVPKIINGGGLT
jgi:hypothetical protein